MEVQIIKETEQDYMILKTHSKLNKVSSLININ